MSATVLIVEDDFSTQRLLVAVVEHLGLKARATGDGHAALAMIADGAADVILLDLIMPQVDGFEVLREMRHRWPELLDKTIVITAAAFRDAGEVPELALARRFLRKPLDIDQLGAAILGCVSYQKVDRGSAYETPPRP